MIRKLLSTTALAALSTAALAGTCPLLMSDIDAALAEPNVEQRLGQHELEKVKQLRKEGEEAHRAGDHAASVEALNRAKEILGVS